MESINNVNELFSAVKNNKISSALTTNGLKVRFFISVDNRLCIFNKGSRKYGRPVYGVESYVKYFPFKEKSNKIDETYTLIKKYKRMANLATFKNSWIENCRNLPEKDIWLTDTYIDEYSTDKTPQLKTLYKYGITTGNIIDGKVISISRIEKAYPNVGRRLRECILNKIEDSYICCRREFGGYDMTISTSNKNGEFIAYLSLEYKDCLNGYYYLLINDENFIGYDVD